MENARVRYCEGKAKGGNQRMVDSYISQVQRLFKSDELKISTDTIEPSDLQISGAILSDFNFFTNIYLWSDFCTNALYDKFQLQLEKAEEDGKHSQHDLSQMSLWSKVEKNEGCLNGGEKRIVSQEPKMNYIFFDSLAK